MWDKLSLKARVTLLFALLLTVALAINVTRLLEEAGPRVAAEDESGVRLATDFVRSAAPGIDTSPDPVSAMAGLVKSLRHLRHITVSLHSDLAPLPPTDRDEEASDVPSWFLELVRPERISEEAEIAVNGQIRDAIVIASNPLDEIGEIWDGIVSQVVIGGMLDAALLAITVLTVGRALSPIKHLSHAMARIGQGQYEVRIPLEGPPELADICRRLNLLAAVLGTAVDEKQHLAERIVTLQDDERRDLARELHDEFGPYLFAIRAHASALAHVATRTECPSRVDDIVRAIGDQVDALQKSNRRVLDKLRPAALDDLGLDAALNALLAGWCEAHPQLTVDLSTHVGLDHLSRTTSLTIYRIIQEGLTNAFRHSDATRVDLSIQAAAGCLRVKVSDNGIGLPNDFRDGLGIRGMKERLTALGGRLIIGSSPAGGVEIEALIPAPGETSDEDLRRHEPV